MNVSVRKVGCLTNVSLLPESIKWNGLGEANSVVVSGEVTLKLSLVIP